MKKYIALGVVLGILLVVSVVLGANMVAAQGPTNVAPTLQQMKQWHESVHGAGTFDGMANLMEQSFGKDWLNQMHGPNGVMNGAGMMGGVNSPNDFRGMMGGVNSPNGFGGMMGGWTTPRR